MKDNNEAVQPQDNTIDTKSVLQFLADKAMLFVFDPDQKTLKRVENVGVNGLIFQLTTEEWGDE